MNSIAPQTLMDLSQVRHTERVPLWRQAVPSYFPGMTLRQCAQRLNRGSIQHTSVASSQAWLIESGEVLVSYQPPTPCDESGQHLSIMLQLQGDIEVHQGLQQCQLQAGQFCLLDNIQPFTLSVPHDDASFIAWQLPREQVVMLHPHLSQATARAFGAGQRATTLIRQSLLDILQSASELSESQQQAALNSFIHLLGMIEAPSVGLQDNSDWRLERALRLIDQQAMRPDFCADTVADEQHISRRQLDRLFLGRLGMTVTARIWASRLNNAATLLRHPGHAQRSITDIALSCGFEDPAHFTRAFKRQFGARPRDWRHLPAHI